MPELLLARGGVCGTSVGSGGGAMPELLWAPAAGYAGTIVGLGGGGYAGTFVGSRGVCRNFWGLGGGMPELLGPRGGGMPELSGAQGGGMPYLFWAHGGVCRNFWVLR